MTDKLKFAGADDSHLAERWELRKKEFIEKIGQIKYLANPAPSRLNSFWYSGDVAIITYTHPKTKEFRKLTLTTRGEIKIKFIDSNILYNGDAVSEALRRGYTDADLVEENKGTRGKIKRWLNNNWFEFACESSKRKGRANIGIREFGETFENYSKGIEFGVDLITDDQKWSDYTKHSV